MTAVVELEDFQHIPVALVDVPAGRRTIDPDWVQTLAADFKDRGQRTPIELLQTGDRFRLIFGAHRLAAVHLNGGTTVKALVKQPADFASEAEIKLAEIVENFMRRELSVLDRAMDVASWREIFEAVKGSVKRGGDRRSGSKSQVATLNDDASLEIASGQFAANFTEAAQKALRLSKDAIFRALKIARMGESVRQRISLLPIADNQSELLALVAEPPARQSAIADRLLDGAASVADAIAIIDNLPAPMIAAAWERMSERFSRLRPNEQEQFFTLHEEAILLWLARRRG